jgi:hypothetical protein
MEIGKPSGKIKSNLAKVAYYRGWKPNDEFEDRPNFFEFEN